MTLVIAHRANLDGPTGPELENTLGACERALSAGFGLELDIRGDRGRGYLSHDPAAWSAERDLLALLELLEELPVNPPHALNVKDEEGLAIVLHELARRPDLAARCFLFDFELAFAARRAQELMAAAARVCPIAPRVSERESSIPDQIRAGARQVWLDEWEHDWISHSDLQELSEAGVAAHVVSPDLHGRREASALSARWRALSSARSICTDFPLRLSAQIAGG